MTIFRFENIEFLYGLLLIPLFIGIYLWYRWWRRRTEEKFGDKAVITGLLMYRSSTRGGMKFFLLMLAYIFLVFAIANPQIGSKLEKVERKGSDLVIALDVSTSMLAQDISPDRLTRAKQAISRLIDRLKGDRIGIVVFAGKAYTQLPITSDYAAAKMFLTTISTEIVPVQGTAIAEAIDLSMNSFKDDDHSKAIIVITDGENHEGDVIEAAKAASEKDVSIYTIGMGLPEGAPIPQYNSRKQLTGYKKDKQGQTVISKLNENMLRQIAAAGDGKFVLANNARNGLEQILEEINELEKTEFEARMFSDYEDRFQYLIAVALFLLVLEFLLFERRSKWSDRIQIFGQK
jgi:Ca-activated chloride channel family protein